MLVGQIETQVRNDQLAAVLARASGAEVEWPTIGEKLAELDRLLTAEPEHLDPDDVELRAALGLRR